MPRGGRRPGASTTLISRMLREWVDERVRTRGRGERLEPIRLGDLRYQLRTAAGARGRERKMDYVEVFGDPERRKHWKDALDGNLSYILSTKGATYTDLGIVVEARGHMSNERGEMVAYVPGQDFREEVVLLVEKMDTADPLARRLASLGVKVVDLEGQGRNYHQEDAARWRSEKKQVFVLTDADLGGHDIAARMKNFGAERIKFEELEALSGSPVSEFLIEEDSSYTKQTNPHARMGEEDYKVLLELGKRAKLRGPGRVELNAQRLHWGNDGYADLVRRAIESRTGKPLSVPPPISPRPDGEGSPRPAWVKPRPA